MTRLTLNYLIDKIAALTEARGFEGRPKGCSGQNEFEKDDPPKGRLRVGEWERISSIARPNLAVRSPPGTVTLRAVAVRQCRGDFPAAPFPAKLLNGIEQIGWAWEATR